MPDEEVHARTLTETARVLKQIDACTVLIGGTWQSGEPPYGLFNRLTGEQVTVFYLDEEGEITSTPAVIAAAGRASGLVVNVVDEDGNYVMPDPPGPRRAEIDIPWERLLRLEVL